MGQVYFHGRSTCRTDIHRVSCVCRRTQKACSCVGPFLGSRELSKEELGPFRVRRRLGLAQLNLLQGQPVAVVPGLPGRAAIEAVAELVMLWDAVVHGQSMWHNRVSLGWIVGSGPSSVP